MNLIKKYSSLKSDLDGKFIRGKVLHAKTGKGVTGASVLIWNTANKVKTDANGYFEIEIPSYYSSPSAMLEARCQGMESQVLSINENSIKNEIELKLEKKEKTEVNFLSRLFYKRLKFQH